MIAAESRGGKRPSLSEALGWIGSRVDDVYGAGIGRLEDVWIDPGTGAPRWLLVKEGRFGGRTTLIPFEDATPGPGHVWVPYELEVVRSAPEVEAGSPLTQQLEAALRRHFASYAPTAVPHRQRREEAAGTEPELAEPPDRPPALRGVDAPREQPTPEQPRPVPPPQQQPPPEPASGPAPQRAAAADPGAAEILGTDELEERCFVELELEGGLKIRGRLRGIRIVSE